MPPPDIKLDPVPRRHHFVPRMLQKRFVDPHGWLHAYNRNRPGLKIYKTKPLNLFVQGQLYSEIGEDGRRRPITERKLGVLEHSADGVISKIIAAARAGRPPQLDALELDVWYLFLTLQWKRVPDLRDSPESTGMAEEVFRSVLADARAKYPHLCDQINRMEEPDIRTRMIHNSRLSSLSVSEDVLDALRSRGMAVLRSVRANKQFVLASRPVVKLTHPGKTDLRHPECETWLAIAPDIAVGLGKGRDKISLHSATPDNVRHLNLAAAGQSTTIASASEALIRSLARPR